MRNHRLFNQFGYRCFSTNHRNLPIKLDTKNLVNIKYKDYVKLNQDYLYDPNWKDKVTVKVLAYNTINHKTRKLFSKPYWGLNIFDDKNMPVMVDEIEDKDTFVKRHGKNNEKFIWTMDLPVKMPGKPWIIPKELEQFTEFIQKSERFERMINPDIENCYAYLCIDQRDVLPGKSQRRPGWHSDSFVHDDTSLQARHKPLRVDSIYLTYDSLPTQFCTGPFKFNDTINPQDSKQVLDFFEKEAKDKTLLMYKPFSIMKMGSECVHRVGFNDTDKPIRRTFAKLTFSTEIFNREGNDHNALYDYNWLMIPRGAERNSSSIIGHTINGFDMKDYMFLSRQDLHKLFQDDQMVSKNDHVGKKFQTVKDDYVKAELATPDELLQTELDEFITSHNVANEGDWKITTSLGDQYFLSSKKMDRLYEYDEKKKMFHSKGHVIDVVPVLKPVQFISPWGYPQYLKDGDYIIKRDDNDIYGVMHGNFVRSYT